MILCFSKVGNKPHRKTLADRMGIKTRKKDLELDTPIEEQSQSNSDDLVTMMKDSDIIYIREQKLVPKEDMRHGMLQFSFLLDLCQPGSVPDPLLVASVLDLVSNYSVHYVDLMFIWQQIYLVSAKSSCYLPGMFPSTSMSSSS